MTFCNGKKSFLNLSQPITLEAPRTLRTTQLASNDFGWLTRLPVEAAFNSAVKDEHSGMQSPRAQQLEELVQILTDYKNDH